MIYKIKDLEGVVHMLAPVFSYENDRTRCGFEFSAGGGSYSWTYCDEPVTCLGCKSTCGTD